MIQRYGVMLSLICLWFGSWAWSILAAEPRPAEIRRHEPIQPIPLSIALEPGKVALGERLFQEPTLSHDNQISCATCHHLESSGTDNKIRSIGLGGVEGPINTPTVFNSGFNFKQFWDGRAATLEDQIDGPVHHPQEMGTTWAALIGKLRQSSDYTAAFAAIYPDGVQVHNVKDAIATFERSLYTPNSRFDRYLRLDDQALTAEEKKGYALFKSVGCVACHQGVGVGGNMFQVFGVMRNYFADRGNLTEADLGRFNVTGRETDRHVFKVPSLRNVAVTSPYLHDGSLDRLEDVVDVMATYQLGRKLKPQDIKLIVQFLTTLTGEYKGRPLTRLKKVVQAK